MAAAAVELEVCTDSVAGCRAAEAAGAQRVELCSGLAEGGLTPSQGLIRRARSCLARARLMVLVRPRGGDFVYTEDELAVMAEDVAACGALGADGVVLGCLTPEGGVDERATGALVRAARQHGLDVTFHRAFDMTRDLSEALEAVARLGIRRVLTSGSKPSAEEGADVIARLVVQAAGRVSVMAGGGVTARNAAVLLAATGVRELHSSAKRRHRSASQFWPPALRMSSGAPPSDQEWSVTDKGEVRRLLAAAAGAAADAQRGGAG